MKIWCTFARVPFCAPSSYTASFAYLYLRSTNDRPLGYGCANGICEFGYARIFVR